MLVADIAGGCTDVNMAVCSTPLGSVEVLDPITEKWELIASLAHPRGRLGLATVGTMLFAIGGDDGDGNCARMGKMVEVYNAELDAWRLAPPMPTYRCGFGVAALHGLICAPNRSAGPLEPVPVFVMLRPLLLPLLLLCLLRLTTFAVLDVAGGWNGGPLSTVEIFNVSNSSWAVGKPITTPRQDASAVAVDGKLLLVGGCQSANTPTPHVELCAPTPKRRPLCGHGMTALSACADTIR